jgi:hypothetical protein
MKSKPEYVLNMDDVPSRNPTDSPELFGSSGTNVLENLISARAMEGKGDFEY